MDESDEHNNWTWRQLKLSVNLYLKPSILHLKQKMSKIIIVEQIGVANILTLFFQLKLTFNFGRLTPLVCYSISLFSLAL